jgi:hypothetical protein
MDTRFPLYGTGLSTAPAFVLPCDDGPFAELRIRHTPLRMRNSLIDDALDIGNLA